MVYRFDDNEMDYVQIESMYWLGCCYIHTYMNEIRLIGIVADFVGWFNSIQTRVAKRGALNYFCLTHEFV